MQKRFCAGRKPGRKPAGASVASPGRGNRRWRDTFQFSPPRKAGRRLEVTYWDEQGKLKVTFGLRRFEVWCVLVAVLALLISALGGGVKGTDRGAVLWLLDVLAKVTAVTR